MTVEEAGHAIDGCNLYVSRMQTDRIAWSAIAVDRKTGRRLASVSECESIERAVEDLAARLA